MLKLFKTSHFHLCSKLSKNPRVLTPIAHLHKPTKTLDSNPKLGCLINELEELGSLKSEKQNILLLSGAEERPNSVGPAKGIQSTVQISHPWPEWVGLMERLLKGGYFDAQGKPFIYKSGELGSKEANCIRTACLNFARYRYSLIR